MTFPPAAIMGPTGIHAVPVQRAKSLAPDGAGRAKKPPANSVSEARPEPSSSNPPTAYTPPLVGLNDNGAHTTPFHVATEFAATPFTAVNVPPATSNGSPGPGPSGS